MNDLENKNTQSDFGQQTVPKVTIDGINCYLRELGPGKGNLF